MTLYVLLEHKPEGKVTASLIGLPAINASGGSEHEALAQLRTALTTALHESKIIAWEVDLGSSANPWLQLHERMKDNPLLSEVANTIAANRTHPETYDEAA